MSKKRRKNKAKEVEKSTPRVVDMSWAAEIIDDEWEDNYQKAGKYDTRILEPLPAGSFKDDEENLTSGQDKKIVSAGKNADSDAGMTSDNNNRMSVTDKTDSSLEITQEYKSSNEESEFSRKLKAAIKELENKDAEVRAQMEEESSAEKKYEEDFDDVLKIRDAETDKTMFSLEDAKRVRAAAAGMDLCDDLDDIAKIRDAETDKTIVSIEDARKVREAAAMLNVDEDLDDIVKIRDAETDKTICSVEEVRIIRDAVSQMDAADRLFAAEKIRDAETDKTIVSIEDARMVREAVQAAENIQHVPSKRKSHVFQIDADGELEEITSFGYRSEKPESLPVSEVPENAEAVAEFPAAEPLKSISGISTEAVLPAATMVEEITSPEHAAEEKVNDIDNAVKEADEQLAKTRKIDLSKIRNSLKKDKKKKKTEDEKKAGSSFNIEEFLDFDKKDEYDADVLLENIITDDDQADKKNIRKRQKKSAAGQMPERIQPDYQDDAEYDYDDDRDGERRQQERPRRRNYDRGGYYVETKSPLRFIPLFLVIALCVLAFITAKEVCFDTPVNSSDYSKYTYTISGGVDTATLAQDLYNMGLIENTLVFRLRALFYGLDCQDGTYVLSPCYSTEKIVNILSGYEYIDE